MSAVLPCRPAARAALQARGLRGLHVPRAMPPLLALLLAAGAAAAQPVSPAEVLLFETEHLARMKAPANLVYEFRKHSNVEPAFTDSVRLDVTRKGGKVHAVLHFLSGARKREIPAVDDAHGNPVLLGFLERDIGEMKRLTGGSVTYFRKRIRMALANNAQVTPQRITYQGTTVAGQAVRIQPYLDDPLQARFENYVNKTYTFVLSEAVPGGVFQVSTSLGNTAVKRPGALVARTAAAGGPAPGAPVPAVATPGTAAPATAQPGAAAPGSVTPVIDETLTLVKVVAPQR